MKTLKKEWLNWIIILLPFVFIALNWEKFPDRIPTHFNFEGVADDYSSKVTGLILFPGINIGLYLLLLLIPYIDPRKKNYSMFEGKWRIIRTFLHVFLSFMTLITCFISLGYKIDVGNVVCIGVLALFMVIGNYMGNIRSNYFIGIRVPWTLENETVWNLTHRFAGRIWVWGSILMIILIYFFPLAKWLMLPYGIIVALVPIIYSYFKYKTIVGNRSNGTSKTTS